MTWHSALLAALLTCALGAATAQERSEFESGRVQYQRTCAQCHGHNMVNSGVTVYDLRNFPLEQEERFLGSVRNGKGSMPSFAGALDDGQLAALWTYVRNRGEPPQPLRVCAAGNNAPLSQRGKSEPQGLDIALAQAIARDAGRALEVVFFESEHEADKSLTLEVNALLSSGVCQLVSAFPLFASDLGTPARATARTPDHDGAKPGRVRPFVPLGSMAATRPYYAMAMGVVTRDPGIAVEALADLQNLKLAAVTGTLAGSALMLYRNGMLQRSIATLSQRENVLEALAAGRFDAALVALGTYDAYRLGHPEARVFRAKFVHPLRVNLGFVGLEREPSLGGASRVIERSLATGELARWAAEAGASWVAPQPPDINPPFSLSSLRAE